MARSVIGLDVGTAAVRAAEVRFGRGTPALVRFGQVALPPGAVVAGEVVDAAAVAAALRRLWKEAGFSGKRVVTGVAGQRVVARTTDLPVMSEDELRSSLPFQVQELIPIPIEDAVIDHQVLERTVDAEGVERLRVLVVAAHRDMLRSLTAALDGAGLSAERVDLIAFALIRALHERDFGELDADGNGAAAEAIVDIGGGVTNVIVHEHGVPQFIRSLSTGGMELTEAISTDLDVDFETAEALKRGGDAGAQSQHAQEVLRVALVPVLEEIRTSLEFWQSQSLDGELRRVIIVGGTTRMPALHDRLARLIGAPLVDGSAFSRVDPSGAGLSAEALATASAVGSIAVGLALSGEALATGDRRISLVPAEIAVQRRERRQVLLTGAGVLGFAALLLGLYAVRGREVSDAKRDAEVAEARTVELEAQLAELRDVEALEADIAAQRDTVSAVLEGDIAWSRLVQEIAAVLPNDVWLTGFNGSRGDALTPGTIQVQGMGFDQTSTARWILRISNLDSLSGLWVPSSTKTPAGTGRQLVTFSSNASLTPAAESDRVSRYLGAS
jgi:type IV pilus assembly protein PilM